MPSGEGKKELWRRDHTLRRWATQAAPLVRSNLAGAMSPVQRAAARAAGRGDAMGSHWEASRSLNLFQILFNNPTSYIAAEKLIEILNLNPLFRESLH